MAHGRPAVRDVCRDGQEARFIDLERFRLARRAGLWQAEDVVMFAQTAFTLWLAPVKWLAAGLSAVRPGSRELRAVGLTLARLRRA